MHTFRYRSFRFCPIVIQSVFCCTSFFRCCYYYYASLPQLFTAPACCAPPHIKYWLLVCVLCIVHTCYSHAGCKFVFLKMFSVTQRLSQRGQGNFTSHNTTEQHNNKSNEWKLSMQRQLIGEGCLLIFIQCFYTIPISKEELMWNDER